MPDLKMEMVTKYIYGGGPIIPGKIYPFVFITIACGAISGFHSLVASGTTPKMINKESDARMIGYGAMLMEGLVGIIALIAASSLFPCRLFCNKCFARKICKTRNGYCNARPTFKRSWRGIGWKNWRRSFACSWLRSNF